MTLLETRPELDVRDPGARLTTLLDPGASITADPDGTGVLTARGTIDGVAVAAFATDPARQGGALGGDGCARIADLYATSPTARPSSGSGTPAAPGSPKESPRSTASVASSRR